MFASNRFYFPAALLMATIMGGTAQAHNLYVLVERQTNGPDSIDVIFEHSPFPGKGTYNQPLLDRGKTWIEQPGNQDEVSLNLKEVTRLGKKFLQTETTTKRPRAIVHSCKWGVYKGRLDYFHGKYLDVATADQLDNLARTDKLPLDISPAIQSAQITLTVHFEDKPLPNKTVWIWSPDGKETKRKTDAAGKITLGQPVSGTYSFATIHTLEDPSGEFEGESYQGIMHGTTCSFRWPMK
jgi:hypothetical protein